MQPNKIIGTDYTTDGSSFFNGHLLYALAELKKGGFPNIYILASLV